MLTKVDVVTPQGTTLSLPLQDTSGGFVVKDIAGLDPVKNTIVTSKFAQIDGTKRQASSRENRNIVIKLGYAPDYVTSDIRSLRSFLYGFLLPKSVVTLKFYMDDVLFVTTQGEVESCETAIFDKDPAVAVSLIHFDPDFIAPASVVVSGHTVADTTEQAVTYPGNSPVGFKFKLNVNRTLTAFTIYNRTPDGAIASMDIVGSFAAGDILEIDTIVGLKGAWLTRAGVQSPVLWVVSPTATWLSLVNGANYIRVAATGAAIPFTIEYLARYGGL